MSAYDLKIESQNRVRCIDSGGKLSDYGSWVKTLNTEQFIYKFYYHEICS